MDKFSDFAAAIYNQKYAMTKPNGKKEIWPETAFRVTANVCSAAPVTAAEMNAIQDLITDRKFLPGGRYLYAAGREFHQVQNCLMLRAEDSREGWADLMQKATMALMTGAGIGVDYSAVRGEGAVITRTGGKATGPLALAEMINCAGRGIMQGGARRSAIWAGLNWAHPDALKFANMKNWSDDVRRLKEKDFNFPATMDGTNISVILDKAFFDAYHSPAGTPGLARTADVVYWTVVRNMLSSAEPGFSVDYENSRESLRNACVAGDTEILTKDGYRRIDALVGTPVQTWNGFEWSEVTPKITGRDQKMVTVTLSDGRKLRCTEYHKWVVVGGYGVYQTEKRVDALKLKSGDKLLKHDFPVVYAGEEVDAKMAYTQGFISADGMDNYNHLSLYEPKFVCESRLMGHSSKIYRTVNGGERKQFNFGGFMPAEKSFVPFNWSVRSRVEWLAGLLDGDGTELKEGGAQIASINLPFLADVQKLLSTLGVQSKVVAASEAGLRSMPDGRGGMKDYHCQVTKRLCIGAAQMQHLKTLGLRCERMAFDKSPNRDATRFVTVVSVEDSGVEDTVYCFTEPKRNLGCFGGVVTGQCTEVTSEDDSDICNLGSLNLARFDSLDDFKKAVELATIFLLAGTLYSDIPYAKVAEIREKNRRLGLGLMGIHEWLLKRNMQYGENAELGRWLECYQTVSTETARRVATAWGISCPVKVRAIAPTGTIGIIAETTTGVEPIFCVAYRRRYKAADGIGTNFQYVVDPTAKKLIESGVAQEAIEDAYVLAKDVERRVAFQAWVQGYVDQSISSTINLPSWGADLNNEGTVRQFGEMLLRYLPKLRGITVYPDGARGGQPLTPVQYATAMKHEGQVFVEQADICDISGKGGSCGS